MLFWSCAVWCCSCCVCVTCFSSYVCCGYMPMDSQEYQVSVYMCYTTSNLTRRFQVARSTALKTKNYVFDVNARVYCGDITKIREDASSMVTTGATANTAEGNSCTSRDSSCCIHIHTGNLSLSKYRNTRSVCMLNTSNPTRSFQVARSTALKTKNYVFDVNARVYCGCIRIHIHEFKVILLYVRRL